MVVAGRADPAWALQAAAVAVREKLENIQRAKTVGAPSASGEENMSGSFIRERIRENERRAQTMTSGDFAVDFMARLDVAERRDEESSSAKIRVTPAGNAFRKRHAPPTQGQ